MNCNLVQQKISAYLDQELGGSEMLAMRRHLDGCPDCAAEARAEAALKRFLAESPVVEAPAYLEENLLAAIQQERAKEPRTARVRWSWAMGAAVMAMAFTLGVLQFARPDAPADEPFVASDSIERDKAMSDAADPLGGGAMGIPVEYVRR